MVKKNSVVVILIVLCMLGTVNAQEVEEGSKPKNFALLPTNDEGDQTIGTLLKDDDLANPTILMFVSKTDEQIDKDVVKLAKLIDYIVSSYKEKGVPAGAAVIFLRKSSAEASTELQKARLTIPVAVAKIGEGDAEQLDVYKISPTDPVTVVMWSNSVIQNENIIPWTSVDLVEDLDEKGQAMVDQFIGLLD